MEYARRVISFELFFLFFIFAHAGQYALTVRTIIRVHGYRWGEKQKKKIRTHILLGVS